MTVVGDRVHRVVLPKWGMSMTHGRVIAWVAGEGQRLRAGDDLVDVETEKITGTMEAPDDGVLRRIVAPAGTDVPVGATIALLAAEDVPDAVLDAEVAAARAAAEAMAAAPVEVPQSQGAQVDGRRVAFVRMGEASGDPVLLVHGFAGDKTTWAFVGEPLSARHTVLAMDLPGHGESAKDVGDGSLATLARTVLGVLDAAGAARAHLVGHSLGGAVVTAAAGLAPDRVRSLTLVAPAGLGRSLNASWLRGFVAASGRREVKARLVELYTDDRLVTRQLVEDTLRFKRVDGVQPALETLLQTLLDGDRPAIDLCPELTRMALPVLVVWGAADRIAPPPAPADLPTSVTPRMVAGAGHVVPLEEPAEVRRAIEDAVAAAA